MLKLVESRRAGCKNLEIEGYRFRKNKSVQSKIYWKCVENNCFSTVTTNLQLTSLVNLPSNHNHPPKENEAKRDALKQRIIHSVKKDPTKNISEIYENIIEDVTKATQVYQNFFVDYLLYLTFQLVWFVQITNESNMTEGPFC